MEVEPLVLLVEHLVDGLDVAAGPQRDHDERLGLAAREHGRAVDLWEGVDLGPDVADLVGLAAVEPAALVEDHLAHHAALGRLERLLDVGDRVAVVGRRGADVVAVLGLARDREERVDEAVADLPDAAVEAGLVVVLPEVVVDLGLDHAVDLLDERLVGGDRLVLERLGGPVALVAGGDHLGDPGDDLLDRVERELEGRHHVVLGDLVHLALDHRDRVGLAGDDEVDVGLGPLRHGREQDEVAVDAADADVGRRAVERRAAKAEGGRRADPGHDVGVGLLVGGEDVVEDLDLVPEPVGEERADGPVDQARRQRLLVGRPALALEEAAGEGALRREPLAVVDGEGEERLAVADLGVGDGGRERDGVAESRDDGAVGLLGELAGLERQRFATDLDGLGDSLGGCHGVLGCGPIWFGPWLECGGRRLAPTSRGTPSGGRTGNLFSRGHRPAPRGGQGGDAPERTDCRRAGRRLPRESGRPGRAGGAAETKHGGPRCGSRREVSTDAGRARRSASGTARCRWSGGRPGAGAACRRA